MTIHLPISAPYLSVEDVAKRYGVSTDSIFRWKRDGKFPKAVKLSSGTTRWRLSDLIAHEAGLEVGFVECLSERVYCSDYMVGAEQ